MNNIWKTALAAAAVIAGLAACERCDELDAGRPGPVEGQRVEMTFEIELPQMTDPAASIPLNPATDPANSTANATAANSAAAERDPVIESKLVPADPATRATSEGTAEERRLSGIWVLQFDGTDGAATLSAKDYYTADTFADGKLRASLIESLNTISAYLVANVGETCFDTLAVGATSLDEFRKMDFDFAPTTSVPADGLPMVGLYQGLTSEPEAAVELTRMVARIDFTCQVDWADFGSFKPASVRLRSYATGSAYGASAIPSGSAGLVPDASDAGNFADDEPIPQASAPFTVTWYLAENMRGTVDGLTAQTKGLAYAPTRSTCIEVIGDCTVEGETFEAIYRIYPGMNESTDFNIVRNYTYTVTSTIRGMNENDLRVSVNRAENLSAYGTANSYIVNRAGATYYFDATVMGNGATTPAFDAPEGGVDAPAIVPQSMTPAYAKVLWETGSQAGGVIASVKLNNGGFVEFTTAGNPGEAVTEGNALIGVFDSSNQLLWSWHIWSTSYNPEVNYDVYTNHESKNYDVMQFNLGADATSAEGEVGRFGLLYQWGRKDPFIGAKSTTSLNDSEDYAAYTASEEAYKQKNVQVAASGAEQIANAIRNPTTFYYHAGDPSDWVCTNADYRIDNLWGNPNSKTTDPVPTDDFDSGSKSIYDPCPPGWRVAPQDTWTGFTTTGQNSTNTGEYVVYGGFNCGWNFYTGGSKSGPYTFYPAAGGRRNLSGALNNVGTSGFCWSSSPYSSVSSYAGRLGFHTGNVYPLGNTYRAHGLSIRCVRDVAAPGPGGQEEDLSAKATANCYIVNRAGAQYKFKATVTGNGRDTEAFDAPDVAGAADAPAIVANHSLNPQSVKVLWETNTQNSVIASVSLSDGYVHFTTAGTRGTTASEGNAVIAVLDASGDILWSWHIWSTKYDPNASYDVYTNFAGKNYSVMKFNLGADATAQPGEVGLFGLLYQWGRKDPFIGARTTTSPNYSEDYATTWTESGYGWVNYDATANTGEVDVDPITFSIKNPTTFLFRTTEPYDWASPTAEGRRDNLWGNPNSTTGANPEIGSKSIYDPCPVGWRVAPADTWTGFTSTGESTDISSEFNVSEAFNGGWKFYTGGWESEPTTFYPVAGYRTYNTGKIVDVLNLGLCWSSSPKAYDNLYSCRLRYGKSSVSPMRGNLSRSYGFSIRCVKEK